MVRTLDSRTHNIRRLKIIEILVCCETLGSFRELEENLCCASIYKG